LKGLLKWVKGLNSDIFVLYYVSKDPRVLLQFKVFIALLVAYLLSPVDLISDFIPILGLLDDLVIVPLGASAVLRLIPDTVVSDARERANRLSRKVKIGAGAALVIILGLIISMVANRFIGE